MHKLVLIEDNQDDVFLAQSAIRRMRGKVNLHHFSSAVQATKYFEQETNDTPDLIVLDLGLPDVQGFEFMEQLRQRFPANQTPIVVFSTSQNSEDKHNSYLVGANSFIEKPTDFEAFIDTFRNLTDYWININKMN